jgi:hypothetical protein
MPAQLDASHRHLQSPALAVAACTYSCVAGPAAGEHACWTCLLLQVKETATRMLTNFSVQAGTNDFYTAQRLFRDAGIKVLPQVGAGQEHPVGH